MVTATSHEPKVFKPGSLWYQVVTPHILLLGLLLPSLYYTFHFRVSIQKHIIFSRNIYIQNSLSLIKWMQHEYTIKEVARRLTSFKNQEEGCNPFTSMAFRLHIKRPRDQQIKKIWNLVSHLDYHLKRFNNVGWTYSPVGISTWSSTITTYK